MNTTTKDSHSQTKTTAFGLSKDLTVPINVKICYLKATRDVKDSLASLSQKFENPEVFNTLSNIYRFSDLYVQIAIYDGNSNVVSIPVQTSYKSFNNNGKREWDQYLKLAINYNQVSIDAYLKITVYEIVNTKPKVFGTGYLSLFNKKNSTLRKGSQKIPLFKEKDDDSNVLEYNDIAGLTDVESNLIRYEDGQLNRIGWLDNLVWSHINSLDNPNTDHDYYLYLELPNFDLPIVYSDITYQAKTGVQATPYSPPVTSNLPENENELVIYNKVEIPISSDLYDPDFQSGLNNQRYVLDPIQQKSDKLERAINNNSILDKELRPSPEERDKIIKILLKPSNFELTGEDRKLIWRFRYFYSKNNSINDETSATRSYLPKFLKSIEWENEDNLKEAFEKIILQYWSADNLPIGDALELLGDYFNPYVLGKSVLSTAKSTGPVAPNGQEQGKQTSELTQFDRIFEHVAYLRYMAVHRLEKASSEELLLYLLQLVQALKYESLIFDPNDLSKWPLANFLIDRSIKHAHLGNFFYWYVKVEKEDQYNSQAPHHSNSFRIYSIIQDKYIEKLKHSKENFENTKNQIKLVKKLTDLVELLRTSFRKNEATSKKVEFLREYLANSSNELLKFTPVPLPLDPSVMICGCYPEECSVFKSSLAPLKITFKTVPNKSHSAQLFGKKSHKYKKYPLMFKIGDDLRQDQFVIQIINLMDQLLKSENFDLKLTPYKILATSPIAGMIQFVPNETLDTILSMKYPISVLNAGGGNAGTSNTSGEQYAVSNNGILSYLRLHSKESHPVEPETPSVLNSSQQSGENSIQPLTVFLDLAVSPILMDNYVKSCAGYCVITYLLGVGDRHLDNLLLSSNGKFWHADFGYILGHDPKPFPPLMKLPIQVIDGMGGLEHENFKIFQNYCFETYTRLRKNSNLILNLFQLMLDANIPDIKMDTERAVEKVQEKFCLELSDEEAILHFQNLITDSVNAFFAVVIDRLHTLAQYWRA
ncbi:1-phosphatidylinositol 3-kinase [Scheffersomyces xylosifermentans]|uniref:1-phosphatidylinositol 3-kinase n=1 Tax=Scheffersomyces xylosifermentans TaxID=1304137 RepID=UPI00315DC0A0